MSNSSSNNIKVVCRFRPPNAVELRETGGESIVQISEDGTNIRLKTQEGLRGAEADGFTYDRVFQMNTPQQEVYDYGVKGIVDGASARLFHASRPLSSPLRLSSFPPCFYQTFYRATTRRSSPTGNLGLEKRGR